ncbi:MAG: FAD-dependent oxidoreductase [Pseudomonadota bacterium]
MSSGAADAGLDVAVVGGGIVGICCALSLIESGRRVTLIDKGEPGQATSYGNAGTISPWSVVPQSMPGLWKQIPGMLLRPNGPAGVSLKSAVGQLPWLWRFLRAGRPDRVSEISEAMAFLCRDSVSLYRRHLEGTGAEDLIRDSLYVAVHRNPADADPDSLGYRLRIKQGAQVERIGADELRRLEPALSKDIKAAILIHDQARALDPGGIGKALAEKVRRLGGDILRTSVRNLKPRTNCGWMLNTEAGDLSAAKVVLSAGAWSTDLLKSLGVSVPLTAERGYHVSLPNADIELNNSIMDADNHFIANAMTPGLRFAGIAEFAPIDAPLNPARIETLVRCASKLIPGLDFSDRREWMGVRPSFPDSLPLIEELHGHKDLFAAFGHSHWGLMMAPKTGRVVADLITGNPVNADLTAYGSGRFRNPKSALGSA